MINYLKAKPPKSSRNLSSLLEISQRSVYRYIDLLIQLGFDVQKDRYGKFFIPNKENTPEFNPQEIDFLKKLVKTAGKNSKLAHSVLNKISNWSNLEVGAENLFNAHLGKVIEKLSQAIAEEKQVVLKKYYSANSQSISNRLIEPTKFTDNYESISGFEVDTMKNKFFNIERVSEVEILDKHFQFEEHHQFYKPDVFGFRGNKMEKQVELKLSLRSRLLLKEEYPLSSPFIKPLGSEQYLFKTKVQSYKAPARFVLGLKSDIEVLGDKGFIQFLDDL